MKLILTLLCGLVELKKIQLRKNWKMKYFKDEIHYSPAQLAELEEGGVDVTGLESGGDSGPARGLDSRYSSWFLEETDGRIAFPWTVHADISEEDEALIEEYLQEMEENINCFDFIHVPRTNPSETSHTYGVMFIPGDIGGGGCYSTLGLRPGYYGRTKAIREGTTVMDPSLGVGGYGAKSTWQVISFDSSCSGITRFSVQHEVLHALGFKHEHSRNDRDTYLTYIEENDGSIKCADDNNPDTCYSQFDKHEFAHWIQVPQDWGGEFELLSVMTYASGAGGKPDGDGGKLPVTVVKNTQEKHGGGSRMSTMDALQVAYRYCKPRGFPKKAFTSCQAAESTGITSLVFLDRLCDGQTDCPNSDDEGNMATCQETDPRTPEPLDCCGRLVVTSRFSNLKYTECVKNGVYGIHDNYDCDMMFVNSGTEYRMCVRNRNNAWNLDLCDVNYALSSSGMDGTCPVFGTWPQNNEIEIKCKVAGWDNPDECERHECDPNATCMDGIGEYKCTCNEGYTGDGFTCSDGTDGCEAGPCGPNQECTDVMDGFSCTCAEGFVHDDNGSDMLTCVDGDECDPDPCGENQVCTDIPGETTDHANGYTCDCADGYVVDTASDGFVCVLDTSDACDPNPCSENQYCENGPGGFECYCDKGYEDSEGRGVCTDIDECDPDYGKSDYGDYGGRRRRSIDFGFSSDYPSDSASMCGENEICVNTPGSFECDCTEGYEHSTSSSSDGSACSDVNECDTDPCGDNQTCANNDGSYDCTCSDGYEEILGIGCVQINDCEEMPGMPAPDCDPNATCNDLLMGYECTCNSGFTGDGKTCENVCDPNPCIDNADCTPDGNSHKCDCKSGFFMFSDVEKDECKDINECDPAVIPVCGDNQTCTNIPGSYSCHCNLGLEQTGSGTSVTCTVPCNACPPGYVRTGCSAESGGVCVDIDECAVADSSVVCGENQLCTNIPGSYSCHCELGFEQAGSGTSVTCTNVDDCRNNNCDENATCHDGINGFVCVCNEGFNGDGITCEVPCNACPPGYVRTGCSAQSGGVCVDIDECAAVNGFVVCGDNQTCTNVQGSYSCQCEFGFEQAGSGTSVTCFKIDPCFPNPCRDRPVCDGSTGFAVCSCPTGYFTTDDGCAEIDECDPANGSVVCGENQVCTNIPGSYSCHCKLGFEQTGSGTSVTCTNVDDCGNNNCDENATCHDGINGFVCVCNGGFTGDGVTCEVPCNACPPGYVRTGCSAQSGGTCVDIDECVAVNGFAVCGDNQICTNVQGSYSCQCEFGFEQTGSGTSVTCTDVDDCTPNSCDENATCRDGIGWFSCVCNVGFTGNGFTCVEDDPCDPSPCGGGATCDGSTGSPVCVFCPIGYSIQDGGICGDIDECDPANGFVVCGDNQICTNKPGSYSCHCELGFEQAGSGTSVTCFKNDPCDPNPCGDGATCDGSTGSAVCTCPVGFFAKQNGNCGDIDECKTVLCGQGMKCENTPGSFRCVCKNNHVEVASPDGSGIDHCEKPPRPTKKPKDPCKPNPCDKGKETCSVEVSGDVVSAVCTCRAGMTGTAGNCVDADECAGDNPCGENQECTNIPGSFTCTCGPGFTNSGNKKNKPVKGGPAPCEDTDECNSGKKKGPCGDGKVCENTHGSFTCSCAPGLTENGDRCEAACSDIPTTPIAGEGSWTCKEKVKSKKGITVGTDRSCKIKCADKSKKPRPPVSKCRTYGSGAGTWKSSNNIMQCE